MKQSILNAIKAAVSQINFKTEKQKTKALDLCIAIYNTFIYDGGDFHRYRAISYSFFQMICGSKQVTDEIKEKLLSNKIIECDNSYDVVKHISKGYRFNKSLINGDYILHHSNHSLSHYCSRFLETEQNTKENVDFNSTLYKYILENLDKLTFDSKVYNHIENYKLPREKYKINEEINRDFISIYLDKEEYRYNKEKALQLAKSLNLDLILYKDKGYLEKVEDFIERKEKELKIIQKKYIFDLENKIFRVSRNTTNNRLDYNLTNMKSELLDYILCDGEKLIEYDIANAQFAFFSFIETNLDKDFIEETQKGSLYNRIEKMRWFRVAFDKVKESDDDIRTLYPKTMNFIDTYKKEYGYKCFSNLLQRTESKIIIDYVMKRIISEGKIAFSIHDAFRIKESDKEAILDIINEQFTKLNFKCKLRNKKEDRQVII
jgi:hypothetical protein